MLEITLLDDDGVAGRLRLDERQVSRFTRIRPSVISISRRFKPARRRVERFLEAAYVEAFQGRIRRHYPILMSVWDADGHLHAAAGFRFAMAQPLFLEQYLDAPIEQVARAAVGRTVQRSEIAEIGNLASNSAGASVFLFFALAGYIDQHGCRYATATATRELRRLFRQVGFLTEELGPARPERLLDGGGSWGTYYDHDPAVLVGEIRPAFEPLRRRLTAEPAEMADRLVQVHYPVEPVR